MLAVQRVGGTTALATCVEMMKDDLPNILPALWDTCHNYIKNNIKSAGMRSYLFILS